MKLYSYYRSSAAYRVRIALNLKGLAYETAPVHLVLDGGQQHSEIYRDLNPQKLVPTLIDGKTVIGQSLAIIEYLEEKQPEPPLLPKRAEQRAYVRQIALAVACDIHPLNNLRVQQYLARELEADQAAKNKWQFHWIKEGLDAVEALVANSPHAGKFVCGNKPGLADIFIIPQLYNARRVNFPLEAYPRLMEIDNLCAEMKEFQDAHPENQSDTPEDMRPKILKNHG